MMPKYNILIMRVSYGQRFIEVEADTEQAAREKALDEAGDYEYREKNADYSIDYSEEIKEPNKVRGTKQFTITDNEGKVIEVTNLDEAIEQAKMFSEIGPNPANPLGKKFAENRQAYWQDMYDKLIQLKNNQQ